MSAISLLALRAPPDTPAAAVDLVGGDMVVAVLGFAVLFVVFGLRPLVGAGDRAEGCGSCDGDLCGLGGCGAGSAESSHQEVP